jgi:hypothetical protein
VFSVSVACISMSVEDDDISIIRCICVEVSHVDFQVLMLGYSGFWGLGILF